MTRGPYGGTASNLVEAIAAFTGRVRRALLVERVSQAVLLLVAALAAAALLDRLLRLPAGVRAAELIALIAAAAAWTWRRIVPAALFRPPAVEVALRIEQGDRSASGRLAVGTELAGSTGAESPGLASEAIERAGQAVASVDPARIDLRPSRRAVARAAAAVACAVGLAWLSPESARIALLRLVTPFDDVQWPARTMVEPAMASKVHPRGAALALRARAVRGDPATMRVDAEYRVVRDGSGEWRTVSLSAQPDGTLERLIESDGDSVEVVFRTEDMETMPVTVRLLPAPSVLSATATIEPPAYLRGQLEPRTVDLGDGTDRRATVSPPVLAGSSVALSALMEGTVPPPEGAGRDEWLARVATLSDGSGTVRVPAFGVSEGDAPTWTFRWEAAGRDVLELRPEGAEGIVAAERIAFEVPSVEDAPPSVSIVDPVADEAVTVSAVPEVAAEARDDLGVTRLWLEVSVLRDGTERRSGADVVGGTGTSARVEHALSIASTGARPGDRVVCVAKAIDAFERDGAARAPVAGSPRVFRIISEADLSEQVRSRLGQMREAAERLRDEQRAAADTVAAMTDQATDDDRARAAAQQARMADRIGSFERALSDLSARLARNGSEGDGLGRDIERAAELARSAGTEAQRATEAAKDAGRRDEAAQSARAAESSLSDLAASLSRDRETAELARRIDRLGERIDAARRATAQAASKSMGKDRSQLPEEVRAGLDRAAQDQRETAAEARELSEDLARRAEKSEREDGGDPGTAESLRAAQREADDGGLARKLEQAAQQTADNQLQGAERSQQQARQAVERMQEAMRSQRRRRIEQLERRITEAIEAIRALLASVEERSLPVQRLDPVDADAQRTEAENALRLSRNAGGVAESVAAGGREMARPAGLVGQASEQLDGTAVSLRAQPADLPSAARSFEAARASLQEALAAAEAAMKEAEREAEDRRREELRDAYAKVLERQRGARASTERIVPLPGKAVDRRAFVESKRLGADQAAVSALLREMGTRPDVAGSGLYSSSNGELVTASGAAERELAGSVPSLRTVLWQREVEAGIAALMEALADPPEPDDPFAEAAREQGNQPAGGGGQQQAGGRVPPIAELRLLRTMAQRVLDDTAAAERLPESDRPAYLSRVAERQARILELGERWSQAMKEERRRSGAAPGASGEEEEAR